MFGAAELRVTTKWEDTADMNLKTITCVMGAIAMLATAPITADAGETKTKILKYDSKGNVIGYEEQGVKDK